jgi:hypothetical protein
MSAANKHTRFAFSGVMPLAVLVVACVVVARAPAAPPTPWQLARYRIQVLVAVEPTAELAPEFQAELCTALAARSDALLGGPWELTAAPASAELHDRMLSALDAIPVDALPKPAADTDKLMLLAVASAPQGYQVSARELDVRTRALGSVVRLSVPQPAKLRDAAIEALFKAFSPLALIHAADKDQLRLRVRASAIPPRDKSLSLVKTGTVLRPVIRQNDGQTTPVPWTALVVEEAGPEEARARMVTGLKTTLFGYSGSAAEPLALGVTAAESPVSLTLQSPRDAKIGRPVYDVVSADAKTPITRRANAQATAVLPAGELRVVEVRSGQQVMAKVPVVPSGGTPLVLPVAADARLLEAEGYLAAALDELADLAALRQVLISRAEKALDSKRSDEAKDALAELQALKTRQKFSEELSAAQKRVIAEDLAVQQRIDALFADCAKLAEQQLDPKPIETLAAEIKKGK